MSRCFLSLSLWISFGSVNLWYAVNRYKNAVQSAFYLDTSDAYFPVDSVFFLGFLGCFTANIRCSILHSISWCLVSISHIRTLVANDIVRNELFAPLASVSPINFVTPGALDQFEAQILLLTVPPYFSLSFWRFIRVRFLMSTFKYIS